MGWWQCEAVAGNAHLSGLILYSQHGLLGTCLFYYLLLKGMSCDELFEEFVGSVTNG